MTLTGDAAELLSALSVQRREADVLAVSVVVCAYTDRRWHQIVRAVDSLHRQTTAPHEVLVVVDHNPDLLARARLALQAVVVDSSRTKGLAGARNAGIAVATGDVVAFLDDDAHAEADWLERLVAAYSDPDVIGVGGDVVPALAARRPAHLAPEFDWVVGCSYRGLPQQRSTIRNMIGANMSVRRRVLVQVGGFHESLGRVDTLPAGCEETEMCIRATRATGGRFLLEPAARVHHDVPVERLTWAYYRRRCWAEGRSKASVTRLAGSSSGLASERLYVRRTLPSAVRKALVEAVRERSPEPLVRAGGILAGLAFTTAGYARGSLSRRPAVLVHLPSGGNAA